MAPERPVLFTHVEPVNGFEPVAHKHWRWQIRDLANPDGYVQAGVGDIGNGASFELKGDPSFAWSSTDWHQATPAGVDHIEPGNVWRTGQVPVHLKMTDGLAEVASLFGATRAVHPFALSLYPAYGDFAPLLSGWFVLDPLERQRSLKPSAGLAEDTHPLWDGILKVKEVR